MPDDQTQATPQPAPAEGQPGTAVPAAVAGGEPQAAPAPTGTPAGGEPPRLLAGKYRTPEELETAYQEAERELGRQRTELGTTREQRDYLVQQFGYDPFAQGEGNAAAEPDPFASPDAPAQPPPQAGYGQPPTQFQSQNTPFEQVMDAYLSGDKIGAQRLLEQFSSRTASRVVGQNHDQVTALQQGLQQLAQREGLDNVYPVQQEIVAFMAKGLSADQAFYLVNRGKEAAQQRADADAQRTVDAGRAADAGPSGAATPPQAADSDPAKALKDAMLAAGPQVKPEYNDL